MHTPGRLWVRLADTPIAVHIEDIVTEESLKLLKRHGIVDDGEVQAAHPICDMEMLDNGKKIILTASFPFENNDGASTKTYMTLKTLSLYLYYDLFDSTGIGQLSLLDVDKEGSVF